MRRRRRASATSVLPVVLTAGICISVVILIWFGLRAVEEWRHSERRLAERRARETVATVVTALGRDMRGAQGALPALWGQLIRGPSSDIRGQVASAFARYPYPESFFAWRGTATSGRLSFFNRADRRPAWVAEDDGQSRFPVLVGGGRTDVARALRERVERDVRRGRAFSVFEMPLGGSPCQVVARLYYRDAYGEQLEGIVGFTVNLAWARRHYFPAVAAQLASIVGGMPFTIVDEREQPVAGPGPLPAAPTILRGSFPVMFFDPLLAGADSQASVPRGAWAVLVDPQPEIALTSTRVARILAIAAVSAATLGFGLILTARAVRASARVAEMRSDFVSTVTHDLKTPIATIRAIGDTIVRGRINDGEALRDYAQIIVQESKRLTRLVENLLAYARVTDVTEVYAFEPVALGPLVDQVLQGFRGPIAEAGFEVRLDIPPQLPPVRADRTAMRLALDNLVDNAIRYSGAVRCLSITARANPRAPRTSVSLLVADKGVGIPPDEIEQVTRRFFRGRRTQSGGTGLGLAIASRIADDHGGRLTIESRPGEGTTVEIALPVAGQDHEEADSHR